MRLTILNPMHWNLSTCMIILICIIGGAAILTLIDGYLSVKKQPNPKGYRIRLIIYVLCIVSAGITIALLCAKYDKAKDHGLTTMNISIKDIDTGIKHTPVEDKLPDDIKGSIILYYKFGCKDCEAVYDDLKAAVKDKKNIYWVCTQSKQGKKLRKNYPTDEVPSGIYIRKDDYEGSVTFTHKSLFTTDKNGKTVLDEAMLNRLLYLQSEGR